MAETAYLQESVGEPLKMALAAMIVDQPDDAVDFIGAYLVNHAEKHSREAQRAKQFAVLAERRAESDAAEAEAVALAEAKAQAAGPSAEEAALEVQLNETDDVEALYPALLDAIRRQTGTTAAYVGTKGENSEGLPVIGFTHTSAGCSMVDQVLKGAVSEEEPAEGVTFDLFQQREAYEEELAAAGAAVEEAQAPVAEAEAPVAEAQAALDEAQTALDEKTALPEEEADAEGLAAAEKAFAAAEATLKEAQGALDAAQTALDEATAAQAGVLQYPARAFVANVVREERVKFFGIPQCGSYCGVTVRYDSALHAEGIGEPVPEPEAVDEPEPVEAPEGEEGETTEPAAAEPPARAPKNQPVIVPVERVLCVHAMGQSRDLAEDMQQLVEAWAAKLAAAHARADEKRWAASALLREDAAEAKEARGEAIQTAEAEAQAAAEAAAAERTGGYGEDGAPAGVEERAAAEAAVATCEAVLAVCADALGEVATDKIPPPAAAITSIQASLRLCSVAGDSCAAFTGAPDWARVAAALAAALPTLAGEGKKDWAALVAADADGSAPLEGVDVEAAKAQLEGLEAVDAGFYAADALARLGAWAAALAALWDLVKAQKLAADEAAAAEEAEDD